MSGRAKDAECLSPPQAYSEIETLVDLTREEYQDATEHLSDLSLYQTWDWAHVHAQADGGGMSTIVVRRGGTTIGAVALRLKTLPGLGGIAYGLWAPMWENRGATVEHFQIVLEVIRREYVCNRKLVLCIVPRVVNDAGVAGHICSVLKGCGFQRDISVLPYRTQLVDIQPTLDEVRLGFQKRWRRSLAQAERAGFEVRKSRGDSLWEPFLALYREMVRRKGFKAKVDVDVLRRVNAGLPDHLKLVTTIVYENGTPISGDINSHLGHTSVGLLAASSVTGLKSHAAQLVWWEQIRCAKERGCLWCDLGGIDDEHNSSVAQSKGRLGGRIVEFLGRYYCVPSGTRGILSGALLRARSFISSVRQRRRHAPAIINQTPCPADLQ